MSETTQTEGLEKPQETVEEPKEETKEEITEETKEEETKKETALIAALKKELKDKEEFQGIKDVSELAQKYLEVLKKPESEAPTTPDEYKLAAEGELAEKAKDLDTEEGRQAFAEVLKSLGISKKQGAGVYNLVLSSLVSYREAETLAMRKAREEAEVELKKELGDKYDQVFTQTINVLKKVSDKDFVKVLDETGIGNDPRFIKALYKLINMPAEDRLVAGSPTATANKGVFVFKNTPGMN